MKRFHVHLSVPDLAASVRFYSGLFGAPPSVEKPDYAKWMLDDPRVNFAISQRSARAGLNHLGFQADDPEELAAIRARFDAAQAGSVVAEAGAHCCYALSDKHWVTDPQGIAWEGFHTLDTIPLFDAAGACGSGVARSCEPATDATPAAAASSCCAGGTPSLAASGAAPARACCE